jgi:hypothetical protein
MKTFLAGLPGVAVELLHGAQEELAELISGSWRMRFRV